MPSDSKKILEDIFRNAIPLKEMAARSGFRRRVPATYPGGVFDGPMGQSVRVYTPTMKGSIWGEPQQLTLSLLKTDVYDRRYFRRKPVTVDQVVKGAFSPANRDFDDMPHSGLTRPKYGVLVEEGGRRDYEAWSENYPFPCQKTVGQVIIRAEGMRGAEQPEAEISMKDGVASVRMQHGGARLDVDYLMCMKRNVIAVDAKFRNLGGGIAFRLYRHQDQGHRRYMDENGDFIPKRERSIVYHPADRTGKLEYYDYEADADFNGPFEPPVSGHDGRFFWVTQRFPAERTFPQGFQYVMMGLVSSPDARVSHQELQKGLGSPPRVPIDSEGRVQVPNTVIGHEGEYYRLEKNYSYIRNAPGVAATAELPAQTGGVRLYVAVATLNETPDFFERARELLLEAEKQGFEALRQENEDWYTALYERREEGRIFVAPFRKERGGIDGKVLADAFKSWAMGHGGFCSPDPSKLEGSASYAAFDMDNQSWHSLPCYNEIFSEPMIVHNQYEPLFMWLKLVETWHEALKEKAKAIYGLPGMTIAHGYLPPVTPDPWYIENQALDFCMEVPGQVVLCLWNLWDYLGDEALLKDHVYPILRDLAIFYEAYARRNYDGQYYNIAPTVETECWGISYELKYSKNTTAAITVFRKILNCAIEAATMLHVDADLIKGWRDVAEHLPPFPKFLVGSGEILGGNPGGMPRWSAGDHEFFTGVFPAMLTDEINLDSPEEEKALITRTLDTVRTNFNEMAYILIGKFKEHIPCGYNRPAVLIEDDETLTAELLKAPERLLNSRSGRIHLFPAVPDWAEIAFRALLARGGFSVSAAKDRHGVIAVVIRAKRATDCLLMNPWPGCRVAVIDHTAGNRVDFTIDYTNGECIIFAALPGHEYSVDRA